MSVQATVLTFCCMVGQESREATHRGPSLSSNLPGGVR